eukprot:TRINITY_DN13543_c0_g1_i1.p1 TRINITY_DN13543_c0_g1~~TRINITY_DN13543_c0_g1_i1.p1  ORF type:complete len:159 (-),score=13.14 TRINITY_DN13543_c0_g1_i1:4-426(-)
MSNYETWACEQLCGELQRLRTYRKQLNQNKRDLEQQLLIEQLCWIRHSGVEQFKEFRAYLAEIEAEGAPMHKRMVALEQLVRCSHSCESKVLGDIEETEADIASVERDMDAILLRLHSWTCFACERDAIEARKKKLRVVH